MNFDNKIITRNLIRVLWGGVGPCQVIGCGNEKMRLLPDEWAGTGELVGDRDFWNPAVFLIGQAPHILAYRP